MPSSASAAPGEVLYTHSSDSGEIVFIDLDTEERVVDFFLNDIPGMDQCLDNNGDGYPDCYLIGGQHLVMEDRDYVVLAINETDATSTVARVAVAEPHEAAWQLKQLDFTNTESNGACPRHCGSPGEAPDGCGMRFVHDVVVTDENVQEHWVELIVVDTSNSRIEKVRLDYGADGSNSCGEVLWVLDSSHPEWPQSYSIPNAAQILSEPEGAFLLNTFHTQDASGSGLGRVVLWDLSGIRPAMVWQYPEGEQGRPYLNTPHMGQIKVDPATGERFLLYAHSFGNSRFWGGGRGGTFGVASLDDLLSPPIYMGEWDLPMGFDPLEFPREFDLLPNGTFFGVDSGCYLIEVPQQRCPSQIYWFDAPLPSSTLSGRFTSTHREQDISRLDATQVSRELTCGLEVAFEAEVLPTEEQGADLRAAQLAGGTSCFSYRY